MEILKSCSLWILINPIIAPSLREWVALELFTRQEESEMGLRLGKWAHRKLSLAEDSYDVNVWWRLCGSIKTFMPHVINNGY